MCALAKQSPLSLAIGSTQSRGSLFHPQRQNSPLLSSAADSEFNSVFDPCAQGQETRGVAYGEGKSDTPQMLVYKISLTLGPLMCLCLVAEQHLP